MCIIRHYLTLSDIIEHYPDSTLFRRRIFAAQTIKKTVKMLDKIVKNDRVTGLVTIATLAILIVLLVRSKKSGMSYASTNPAPEE